MILKSKLKLIFENKLVNKSIKVLFLRLFGVVLFFSLTLFLTNSFESSLVGKYDFSRSLLMFLGAITLLGMQQSIVYYSGYLTSKKSLFKIKDVYKKMLIIMISISFLFAVLCLLINPVFFNSFFNKNVAVIVFKTVVTLLFYGLTILNIETFRAIDKIIVSEIFRNIIRYLIFIISVIVLFYTQNDNYLINAFLLNFVAVGIISSFVLAYYFKQIPKEKTNLIGDNIGVLNIIKRSSPMAISSIAFILMQSVDIILLGKFTDFKMVAYYAVTVKLTMIISLVLTSVNAVIAPKISELFNLGQYKNLNNSIKNATRLIFVLTIPVILIIVLLSSYLLNFFGNEYIVAKNALYILLLGQAFNALCGSVGIYMNMTGKQNTLQILLITALLINITLNWILIPKYDMVGAAIATSFSMIFWNILGAIYLYKKDNIKTFLN